MFKHKCEYSDYELVLCKKVTFIKERSSKILLARGNKIDGQYSAERKILVENCEYLKDQNYLPPLPFIPPQKYFFHPKKIALNLLKKNLFSIQRKKEIFLLCLLKGKFLMLTQKTDFSRLGEKFLVVYYVFYAVSNTNNSERFFSLIFLIII